MSKKQVSKVVVIGSSHGYRLGKALEKIIEYNDFDFYNLATPGQKISTFDPPNYILDDLTDRDHLIVFMGGNDLIKNRPKKIFVKGKKFFKITHCEKESEFENRNSFRKLADIVQGCKAQNLVFDMPFRHLASEDPLPEVIEWLFKCRNHMLKECLAEKGIVLHKHVGFLNVGRTNRLRSRFAYRKLLVDDIHFKPEIYRNIADNVLKRMLRINKDIDNMHVSAATASK
jgi:lysophospholipase L1-like esterase